jgi:hypothetical protein
VDTGASYSIFPYVSPEQATGPFLRGPGGQNIPCWRERRIVVSFAGRRFEWDFVLAKVYFAIVGADFLKHFGLVVDLSARWLLDATTLHQFPAVPTAAGSFRVRSHLLCTHQSSQLRCRLKGFLMCTLTHWALSGLTVTVTPISSQWLTGARGGRRTFLSEAL